MAEGLIQRTLDLMGALRAGSIPGTGDFFSSYFFMMMMVERRAGKRVAQALTCRNERSECRRLLLIKSIKRLEPKCPNPVLLSVYTSFRKSDQVVNSKISNKLTFVTPAQI